MPGNFDYEHPEPLCATGPQTFEEWRELADRNRPARCPACGVECPRIPSLVRFNTIFPGSTRADDLANRLTRESVEAQAEGFRSKDELDTAIGLAEERAKQMGKPGKQLIGPVKSPFEGPKFKPSADDQQTSEALARRELKAFQEMDPRKVKSATAARKEHEQTLRKKAAAHQQKFTPERDKAALKKAIAESQSARGCRA